MALSFLYTLLFTQAVFWGLVLLGRTGSSAFLMLIKKSRYVNHSTSTFSDAIVGIMLLASGWAVFRTGGDTVLWLWLLPLTAFFTLGKAPKRPKVPVHTAIWPWVLMLGGLFSTFYWSLWYDPEIPNILHFDEVYYAVLSAKMGFFGVENTLAAHPELVPKVASPYHYAELWFLDALSAWTGANRMYLFSVVIKSVFSVIASLGMLRFMQTLKAPILWQVLGIFTLFFAPFLLDYSRVIQGACMAHQVKSLLISFFLIWSGILAMNRNPNWFMPLLCLPVVNIATALAVLGTLFVFGLWRRNWLELTLASIQAVLVGAFYFFQPPHIDPIPTPFSEYLSYYNWTYFKDFMYRHAANLIMYLPFAVLMALGLWIIKPQGVWLKRKGQIYKGVLVFITVAFVIGFSLMYATPPLAGENAEQMHILFGPFILHLFLTYFFWTLFQEMKQRKTAPMLQSIYLFLITSLCFYHFSVFLKTKHNMVFSPRELRSEEYIKAVSARLNAPLVFGVSVMPERAYYKNYKVGSRGELMNAYWFSPFSTCAQGVLYLANLNTLIDPYSEDDIRKFDMGSQEDRLNRFQIRATQKGLRASLFSRFVEKEGLFDDELTENQGLFILRFKPDMLVVFEGATLPQEIPTQDSIFDVISKEKIMILQP